MSDWNELAAKCEQASEDMQGRLLDEAWETCAAHSPEFRRFACAYVSGFDTNAGKFGAALDAHAYLDAALTLVPEEWHVDAIRENWRTGAWICRLATRPTEALTRAYDQGHAIGLDEHHAEAATPALALCAASLKARNNG